MPKGGKLAKGHSAGGGGKGALATQDRKQPGQKSQRQSGKLPASSLGVRKDATKNKASGNGGKKQPGGGKKQASGAPAPRPPSAMRQQNGARALTQGLGLSAAGLSALLDETLNELSDKNIRTGAKGGKAQQRQAAGEGPAAEATPTSPLASSSAGLTFVQLGGAAAPPPTPVAPGQVAAAQQPAALAALAGLRTRVRHDPAAVLESLNGWGLSS